MSDKVDRWVWESLFASEHGPSKPGTRLILFVIRMHLWEGDEETFPGQERLARLSGMSLRSVRDHLTDGAKLGWLEISVTVGVRTVYRPKIPSAIVAAMASGEIQLPRIRATTMRQTKRKTPANPAGVNEPTQANPAGVEQAPTPAKSAADPGKKRHVPRQNLQPAPAESAPDSYSDAKYDANRGRALRAARTRLPDQFVLTDSRRKFATDKSLDAELMFAKFTTYYRATGASAADWDSLWQHWCVKDAAKIQERDRPRLTRVEQAQERLNARLAACDDDTQTLTPKW